jgi:inositol phosphorylceramide mannosyltransferase catalytic subunit
MWEEIISLYHKNIKPSGHNLIPKTFHQVWLGSKYPKEYEVFKESFLNCNPDWEFKIWTDKEVESFDMFNRKAYNKCSNLGSKSDIFRYEILYKYGGVYLDTDFYCIKSFNDLLHLDLFAGTGSDYMNNDQPPKPNFFNGLIGCKPYNKFIKILIDNIEEVNKKDFDKIMQHTGPVFFTKKFYENLDLNQDSIILPKKYFYPFPASQRHLAKGEFNDRVKKFILSFTNEKSYCAHLFYTSWQK